MIIGSSLKGRLADSESQIRSIVDEKYEVMVLGTMSSGKTSFINALIGQELLPVANEATTACIISVEHKYGAKVFSGACYSISNHELASSAAVTPSIVRDWNANREVRHIRLVGSLKTQLSLKSRFVLHDTPGPNNSQDDRHSLILLEALRTVSYRALCYVLNASQLGINDDRMLLDKLCKELTGKTDVSVYFILNKVDLLDPEKGEDIGTCVESVRRYLVDVGFEHPIIIPSMSNIALYARKALIAEPMTRAQRLRLHSALDELDESRILELNKWWFWALRLLDFVLRKSLHKRVLERKKLQYLEAVSGLKTLEALLKNNTQLV